MSISSQVSARAIWLSGRPACWWCDARRHRRQLGDVLDLVEREITTEARRKRIVHAGAVPGSPSINQCFVALPPDILERAIALAVR